MNSTIRYCLAICGLTCLLLLPKADAQVVSSLIEPVEYGFPCDGLLPDMPCHAGCRGTCKSNRCGSYGDRERLTGDWGGLRTGLADRGIVIESSLTQFYQGVASGGLEQTFRYGSKLDLFMDVDTGKLGLWEGGSLQVHAVDWQFGQNSILDAAGLAPVNTLLLTPEAEASFGLTGLLYQHELGAGWQAMVGRANMPDLWTAFYPDYGRGADGFMNASALLPLSIFQVCH